MKHFSTCVFTLPQYTIVPADCIILALPYLAFAGFGLYSNTAKGNISIVVGQEPNPS